MIDNTDKKMIQDWAGPENIGISIPGSDHPTQESFINFAKEWAKISPGVKWQPSEQRAGLPDGLPDGLPTGLPGFRLRENITYSALPMSRELPPFLKSLSLLGEPAPKLTEEISALVDRMDLPCELTLYIALECPHCPGMVETLFPLAVASDKIHLHIIDGSLLPEKAAQDKVMSAPCLILDQDFRWTGAVNETEILSMILDRDPARLSPSTLKNILEQGDADWITNEMIKAGAIFDGFIQLLIHRMWSVRLGAMVVVETLGEKAPDLGLEMTPLLAALFHDQEIPVQGDILYALGEIGNLETKAWIRECIKTLEHADLTDAAEDAMEAIDSRFGS